MPRAMVLILLTCAVVLSACAPVQQEQSKTRQQAEVHYKLAMAHFQSNNPTSALRELLIAVREDPGNDSIQVALAQAYQQKKAYAQAEKHYLEALRLSPDDPRYQNNLAALYLDMGEWDKAIDYFDRAAGNLLFLNAHIAVSGKAYAFYKKGDFDNALRYFKDVNAMAPHYAPAYYYQAEVYRALGQPEREKAALQSAIDTAPQYLQARYRLAELLAAEGDVEAARNELETIIDLAPAADWGRKAKDFLRSLSSS